MKKRGVLWDPWMNTHIPWMKLLEENWKLNGGP